MHASTLRRVVLALVAVASVGLIVITADQFEARVREHLPGWLAAARRLVGSDADGEDVVFRVLEKLWVAVQRESVALDGLGPYGMRAVQNEAVDLLRGRRRASHVPPTGAEPAGGPDPLDEVLARDGARELDRTLATLEAEDRRVVELRAFERRSYDDIARDFRDPAGAPRTGEWAKKRFQRACQRLHAVAAKLLGGGGGGRGQA